MLLVVGGLQILGVGMIADMINRRLGGFPRAIDDGARSGNPGESGEQDAG
jgi:hypothetical protein